MTAPALAADLMRRAYRQLLQQVPLGMQLGAPRLVETPAGDWRVEADLHPTCLSQRAEWLDPT